MKDITEYRSTPAENDPDVAGLLIDWYEAHGRDIAWRHPGTSPWGVLLSEVMSQQTPVVRVEPAWIAWMERWPTPAALASASNADVLRAWDRLGYPRRALRLKECAQAIVEGHGGEVPCDVDALLALPGIGDYTARAVAAFAFGLRVPVVDTNVRRVYARLMKGQLLPGLARRQDLADVAALLPERRAPEFSVAIMELGALVCTTKPACSSCPLIDVCSWQRAGRPEPAAHEIAAAKKRVQKFEGTDRQVRGKIMRLLREARSPVPLAQIDAVWEDAAQRSRALFSLVEDGLAVQVGEQHFALPD